MQYTRIDIIALILANNISGLCYSYISQV